MRGFNVKKFIALFLVIGLLFSQIGFSATFTKYAFSGSTSGKAVKVSATATTGTTIHTAVSGTSSWDEVWLYATNNDAAAVNLTLEWGTTTAADGNIQLSIPAKSGLTLVLPGLILQNGMVLTAFAGTADVILITGYVNRIA